MRKVILVKGEVYHVYNRSIEQRPVFTNRREYSRALIAVNFYRFGDPPLKLSKALVLEKKKREKLFHDLRKRKKLVEIISYCLMPNHFHFLLGQNLENGISKFLSNFTNSYTRYFNTRRKRIGPLFQGIFKAVRIESDEQLIHVSRYIHLNPVTSCIIEDRVLDSYPWSSLPEYLGTKRGVCNREIVLGLFSSKEKYRRFVHDQIDYAKKLALIKHLALEGVK